jgi:hypothetical protein
LEFASLQRVDRAVHYLDNRGVTLRRQRLETFGIRNLGRCRRSSEGPQSSLRNSKKWPSSPSDHPADDETASPHPVRNEG